jgi:NitT/TauT family transport system ATP-binding protein
VNAVVQLEHVAKSFGDLDALAPIDLEVGAGEVVTLLGPSGCGKTTLLRMVAGLEPPSSGSIAVGGTTPSLARAAKVIGLVPQTPALLPWRTVEANARLLLDVNRRANPTPTPDHVDLLHQVGLGDFLHAHPHQLSGGMQQRVALVRAFALGSSILLMDEPFASLDEITRADMRHLLGRLCEQTGASVLFVTHSIAESVFLSDRVVVLSQRPGRVVGTVPIDLPRPRQPTIEDEAAFFDHETWLRALLHEGAGRSGTNR